MPVTAVACGIFKDYFLAGKQVVEVIDPIIKRNLKIYQNTKVIHPKTRN